jgi:superfamily II DNA or RNA helicase
VFCTSVAHAYHVAEQFRTDGISAISLNGGTDKEIRRMVVKDFRENKIKVITSVDIFSEGVDLIGCHVGIFLRPTMSLGLYLQQCGRILRPAPGKSHAIILDHVNNASRHDLPDADREWTLTDDKDRRKKKPAPSIRVCVKCFAASPSRALVCVECGHVFEVKPRQEVIEKDGELVELTPEEIAKKIARREQGRSRSLDELRQYGKKMGYKPGWADRVHKARERKQRSRSA